MSQPKIPINGAHSSGHVSAKLESFSLKVSSTKSSCSLLVEILLSASSTAYFDQRRFGSCPQCEKTTELSSRTSQLYLESVFSEGVAVLMVLINSF